MKKLIGMALMAVFAITAANTADAKVFKNEGNKHKTKTYHENGAMKHKTKYSNNLYATPTVKNNANKHKIKL